MQTMTRTHSRYLSFAALLGCALVLAAMVAAPADARKVRKGLVLSGLSKKGGSVRPPNTIQVNVGLRNPSRKRARPQPLTVTLGGGQAQTFTFTPGIRRRSSTTLAVALVIPENVAAAKYSLTACLGGKVYPGFSRCRTAKNKVTILSPKINLAINPTSKAFGDVPVGTDSPQQAYTITNNSLGPTSQPTVTLTGVGFLLASNGCTVAIPAGGACSVSVLFHPTAAGNQSGSVKLSTTGGSVTATLTGNGV